MKKVIALICFALIMTVMSVPAFAADYYEPNNTIEDSAFAGILWDASLFATISDSNDVDCYRFTAHNTGYFTLKMIPPSGKDYSMYVYRPGLVLESANIITGEDGSKSITFPVTDGDSYFVMVYSPNHLYSDSESYQLKKESFVNSFEAAYEYNNTVATAYRINLGSLNVDAAISSPEDIDYYRFTADTTGSITLSLLSPNQKNYSIMVTDANSGTLVGSSSAPTGQTDYAVCNVTQGRDYIIWLFGAGPNDYSPFIYSLRKVN